MTLLKFMALFDEFRSESWDAWRKILARITPDVREFFMIIGRGAGKSRIAALLAVFFATGRTYRRVAGESIYVAVIAPDRRQARVTFRYVLGLLRSVPTLADLIQEELVESVELSNGVIIEVVTASTAAPRGRSYALVIVEEAAFLPTDASANPDVEIIRAIGPALARVPGSLLVVLSSPYARRGVLWDVWQKFHDKVDGETVVIKAPTLELNPTFNRRAIERAYEEDPAAAASEYGAEFRSDIEAFLGIESLASVSIAGRHELPPVADVQYFGFFDGAGGSGQDSAAMAIAHIEQRSGRAIAVLDTLREVRPRFSPADVVAEFSEVFTRYGIYRIAGDRWAGEWPREQFRAHGLDYLPAEHTSSEFYLQFLAIVNSKRCELLDHKRFQTQATSLERRTSRDGRDKVTHPVGGHDDVAVVGAAVIVLALADAARPTVSFLTTGVVPPSVDELQAAAEQEARERRDISIEQVNDAITREGVFWP